MNSIQARRESSRIVVAVIVACFLGAQALMAQDALPDECVVVGLHDVDQVASFVLFPAEQTAAAIFRDIHVAVYWNRPTGRRGGDCARVEAYFLAGSPATLRPNSWAYTEMRQAGVARIHIFVDRVIIDRQKDRVGPHHDDDTQRLGLVMAHEIGHALEGVARHSEEGVMKANYTLQDLHAMRKGRLHFASEDAGLIHSALKSARELPAGE